MVPQPSARQSSATTVIALFIAVLPVCLSQEEDAYYPVRQLMVDREIAKAGIKNVTVLNAMHKVPRHRFVDPDWQQGLFRQALPSAISKRSRRRSSSRT